MDKEVRTYNLKELRLNEDEGPVLRGHAAVFDELSLPLREGGRAFREKVAPGAFANTLASKPDVVLLGEHQGWPLARTTSGTLKLSTDENGLQFEAPLDESDPDVQRTLPKIRRGDLDKMSFAFRVVGEEWQEVEDDVPYVRTLTDVSLDEGDISIVLRPAYPQTEVAARSLEAYLDAQGSEEEEAEEAQGSDLIKTRKRRLDIAEQM